MHHPAQELSLILITTGPDTIYNSDESVLEYILSKMSILHSHDYVGINNILVTMEQDFETGMITGQIAINKLPVSCQVQRHIYLLFLK
jgi:hypothetical protein